MAFAVSGLEEGIQLVKFTGRLDMQATNAMADQFAFSVGNGRASAIVDLSEVEFLASIGMRMLISGARGLNNRGKKMVLLNPTPSVKEALMTAGFDQLIPICDDIDEALSHLKEPVA